MIDNNDIQAAIITKLKANAGLTAFLTARSAAAEIRELEYQGAVFAYPTVRVGVGTLNAPGITESCYTEQGDVTFMVDAYSESDSSKEADQLAGLVADALIGSQLSGSGFRSLVIQFDGLVHAARATERIWRATSLFRTRVYETT